MAMQLMNPVVLIESFQAEEGVRLRYARLEEGTENTRKPLIYIPGLGGSVKTALPFLKRMFPDCGPLFSLDPRGFGLNQEVLPFRDPYHYLNDFHQWLTFLKERKLLFTDHEPVLMGLSLGGIYASLYVLNEDHPFKALVLLAPAFQAHPVLFNWRFKLKEYLNLLFHGPWAKTTMPYRITDLTCNPRCHVNPLGQEPLTLPSLYLFRVDRMCQKVLAHLHRITLPTGVIVPEADRICDPQAMVHGYEKLGSSQKHLWTYAGLFHDIMQEPDVAQEAILRDIRPWLSPGEVVLEKPETSLTCVS